LWSIAAEFYLFHESKGNLILGLSSGTATAGLGPTIEPHPGGVVWELSPPMVWGTESVLHSFTGSPDGQGPENAVIFDSTGNNLYGTTFLGGSGPNGGYGTVFQLVPVMGGWTENILYNFQDGTDGGAVTAGLTFDPSGNLYGATTHAGTGGGGTIFELSPPGAWNTFTVLYSITGNIDGNCDDGAPPGSGATLAMDGAGNIYGTTCIT
jgi:hypothetical protein